MNCELPDVQAGFRKGRGPIKINNLIKKKKAGESEIRLPSSIGSLEKKRVPGKRLHLLY